MSIVPPTSPFLPRFSSPRDIDEFVAKLEAFERGELGAEQFRAFRLTRGVYGQRQEGLQMLRVKIPMGLAGRAQLEALADVAERWSRGFGHVTTRQNLQFHFMKMADAETAMRRCDEAGLTTREACGNSVRTVTACELAEVCASSAFDVTPYAEAITRHLLGHPLSATLPRKFKIAMSGCGSDCAVAAIHDVGFVAKVEGGAPGFKVYAAGGLSSSPQEAVVVHEFVPATEVVRVAEALVRFFDRAGNRENRHRARLKYVLKKLGREAFLARYREIRAEVDGEITAALRLPPEPARLPAPPVHDDRAPAPGYLDFRAGAVVEQRQDGFVAVYVRLPLGDVTAAQLRALGAIVDRFGDGSLRFTIDQNVLLPWVHKASLPALHRALVEADLAKPDVRTARDVTSCPGAESCALAVTSSRKLAGAISERLERESRERLRAQADTVIKVSGCPNSCGQHHIADIGFHGGARKEGGRAIPVYQLHLGGGVDERGARFGRQVVKLVARRAPEAVVRLLELYESDHLPGETSRAFFERVDGKRVHEALAGLLAPATDQEASDLGETTGFAVEVGEGECAA